MGGEWRRRGGEEGKQRVGRKTAGTGAQGMKEDRESHHCRLHLRKKTK